MIIIFNTFLADLIFREAQRTKILSAGSATYLVRESVGRHDMYATTTLEWFNSVFIIEMVKHFAEIFVFS